MVVIKINLLWGKAISIKIQMLEFFSPSKIESTMPDKWSKELSISTVWKIDLSTVSSISELWDSKKLCGQNITVTDNTEAIPKPTMGKGKHILQSSNWQR